jgi:hypothetical protein
MFYSTIPLATVPELELTLFYPRGSELKFRAHMVVPILMKVDGLSRFAKAEVPFAHLCSESMALIIKEECIVPPLPYPESVFRDDDHPNRDTGFKNHSFQPNLPDEDCTIQRFTRTKVLTVIAQHLSSVAPARYATSFYEGSTSATGGANGDGVGD